MRDVTEGLSSYYIQSMSQSQSFNIDEQKPLVLGYGTEDPQCPQQRLAVKFSVAAVKAKSTKLPLSLNLTTFTS